MMYARVENGIVRELIPAVDPAFPEIPVEERFHKTVLDQLVSVPENLDVQQYWTYSADIGFEPPIPEETTAPPDEVQLDKTEG